MFLLSAVALGLTDLEDDKAIIFTLGNDLTHRCGLNSEKILLT